MVIKKVQGREAEAKVKAKVEEHKCLEALRKIRRLEEETRELTGKWPWAMRSFSCTPVYFISDSQY
jgi:hypothetical protein